MTAIVNRTCFAGETALVTGGINGVIAQRLLTEAARVAICGRAGQTFDSTHNIAKSTELENVIVLDLDMPSETAVRAGVAVVKNEFSMLDMTTFWKAEHV